MDTGAFWTLSYGHWRVDFLKLFDYLQIFKFRSLALTILPRTKGNRAESSGSVSIICIRWIGQNKSFVDIDVGDAKPIKQRHLSVSPAVEKLLYGEGDRMLVVEESDST